MAFALNRLFRQLRIQTTRSLSSRSTINLGRPDVSRVAAIRASLLANETASGPPTLVPRSVNLPSYFNVNANISKIIRCPVGTNLSIEEPAERGRVDRVDIVPTTSVDLPTNGDVVEKRTLGILIIRRKKMKKHKLRKLRKKMKFEWAKIKQKRELRKEKEFQAKLIAQIKEAAAFDAVKYVEDKIRLVTQPPKTRSWMEEQMAAYYAKQKAGPTSK